MNRIVTLVCFGALCWAGSLSCSDSDDSIPVTEPTPSGDSGVVDTGGVTLTKCPDPATAECTTQAECWSNGEMGRAPECDGFCPDYAEYRVCLDTRCPVACELGMCKELQAVEATEVINIGFNNFVTAAGSYVAIILDGQALGGLPLDCADVEAAPTTYFNDPCYNVLDVRTDESVVGSESRIMSFSRMPSDREVLALIYAFDEDRILDNPVPNAFSCTRLQIPERGQIGAPPPVLGATDLVVLE